MKQKNIIRFNKRFANGEQFIYLNAVGEIEETPKAYYWEVREVYNNILPAIQMIKSKYPEVKDYQIYGRNGLVSQLVPIQRAYNNIKNRKQEYLNRVAYGVLSVEDGSVDIDAIEEEGLSAGKVIVYRQGANPPTFMPENKYDYDFFDNEICRLLQDMNYIIEGFIASLGEQDTKLRFY